PVLRAFHRRHAHLHDDRSDRDLRGASRAHARCALKVNTVSFAAGVIFAVGLGLSGMTQPAKVLGFLDVAGAWDPSLALVMVGAIAVGAVAFAVAGRLTATLLGTPMALPTGRGIDRRLVLGSLAFGVGWGLAGFCPGPALVA